MNSPIDMLYYISIFITSYRILVIVSVVRTLVDLYQDDRCDSRRKSEACTNIERLEEVTVALKSRGDAKRPSVLLTTGPYVYAN